MRAYQHRASTKKRAVSIRRSRGESNTKVHTLVDALGDPVGFHLSGREAHDLVGVDASLPGMRRNMMPAGEDFGTHER